MLSLLPLLLAVAPLPPQEDGHVPVVDSVPDRPLARTGFQGIGFVSSDSLFQVGIHGKLENDWAFYRADRDVEAFSGPFQDGTEFRRARFTLSGTYDDWMDFKASFDFQDKGTGFRDLFLKIGDLPWVGAVKLGHFKEPFSLESLTGASSLTFMERSVLTGLSPGRNVGVTLQNVWGHKRGTWAAGIFRQTDTNAFGSDQGSGREFAFTARGTWLPYWEKGGSRLVHVGGAISFRNPDNNTIRYRSRPESHLAPKLVDTGLFPAGGNRLMNVEAAMVLGPASVQGEITRAEVYGTMGSPSPTFLALYAQASYVLTGEHRQYKRSKGAFGGVAPDHPYRGRKKEGGMGALEAALRYSQINLDDSGIYGGEARILSVGFNWYLSENLRFQVNYGVADLESFGNAGIFQFRFHLDW